MKENNRAYFFLFAILIVLTLAVKIIFFSNGFLNDSFFSGFVFSDTAKINLTIESGLIINFTVDTIDWGTGRVTGINATLYTAPSEPGNKSVGGNWTGAYTNYTTGLILENIGNLNATVYLKTGQNASGFIGGNSPLYQFNITNNKTSSCLNSTSFNLGQLYDVNISGDGTLICSVLDKSDSSDAIKIDILLRIPSDSKTGALEDTITATAYTAT